MILMKHLSLILLCVLFGACGAPPEAGTNSKAGSNGSVNSGVQPGVVSNGNTNSMPSGTPDMTGIPSDPNAVQADPNTPPAGSIEAANRGRVLAEGPPPPAGSKPPSVDAGDNSSVSSEMLKDGSILEKRVFSQNEYVKALEIRTIGRSRSATLILKNGKSVKVPAARIPEIGSPSSAFLLELAGIRPKPTQPEQNGTGAKASQ